jgi:hypothetical protein
MKQILAVWVLLPTTVLAAGAAEDARQVAALGAGRKDAPPAQIGKQRQLFLDDYLIESLDKITRRVCPVRKYDGNPVIVRESDGEPAGYRVYGSVIFDEQEKVYKAWCDSRGGVHYFTSADGIHWEKPRLGLFTAFDGAPSNRVVLSGNMRFAKGAEQKWKTYLNGKNKEEAVRKGWRMFVELWGVFKDLDDPDPARRYKMGFCYIDDKYQGPPRDTIRGRHERGFSVATSPDGIHWEPRDQAVTHATVDGQTHWCRRPGSGRYILYGRNSGGRLSPEFVARHGSNPLSKSNAGRAALWAETDNFLQWKCDAGERILGADAQDGPGDEIYSLHGLPYEGIYVGLVQVYHNYPDRVDLDIQLAVSRDGKHYQRLSDRSPFIPVGGVGQWDRFNNSVANSPPILVGDELRFYYSGRNFRHGSVHKLADDGKRAGFPCESAVGLGTIKRDRFAAMEASFDAGTLRTRPIVFHGQRLHVNAGVKFGTLTVALLDQKGTALQKAVVQAQDGVDLPVPLKLAGAAGKPVRLEFTLANAQLYSFWID